MKFYVTMEGKGSPGLGEYVIVNAACEDTCIQRLKSNGLANWSSVYRNTRVMRRLKLKLWGEI